MERIFHDQDLQEKMERDGFAIAPLLNAREADYLRRRYFETGEIREKNIGFSLNSDDHEHRYLVQESIREIIEPKLEELLVGRTFYGANYVTKEPNGSRLDLHQDNTVCDESKHDVVVVWVPLTNVDEKNGCLTVVPGSHRWTNLKRSFGDMLQYGAYRNVVELLHERYMVTAPMIKGNVLFFHIRMLHGSTANTTSRPRVCIIGGSIRNIDNLRFLHRLDPKTAEVFKIDRDFFWRDNFFHVRPQTVPSLEIVDISGPAFTPEDIEKLAQQYREACQ